MKTIIFRKDDASQMQSCAAFLAELIKEEVDFKVDDYCDRVEVSLTGGY